MTNLLTKEEKSKIKKFVWDVTSGWYEVEDCEVVEHLAWKHSTVPSYNRDFYRVLVHCKFLNGKDEKRDRQVIVTKSEKSLGMFLDEYCFNCLQDFLIEHFDICDMFQRT